MPKSVVAVVVVVAAAAAAVVRQVHSAVYFGGPLLRLQTAKSLLSKSCLPIPRLLFGDLGETRSF